MSGARDWLVTRAYFAGWRLVRLMPERAAYRVFERIADRSWRRHGHAVQRLEANLARVRPEADAEALRELSREGMRSYLRYYCDAFRLPGWSRERLTSTVRTVGDEPVREHLAAGRSVVMFLGHLGNWDHAGAWSTLELAQVTTVAERLEPQAVFEAFLAFREELGMRIVPLTGSEVFRTLLSALREGGTFMPLLADRDLSNNGDEVTSSASGPGWPPGRPRWRSRPVPRCSRSRSSTNRSPDAGTGSSSPGTTRSRCPRAAAAPRSPP